MCKNTHQHGSACSKHTPISYEMSVPLRVVIDCCASEVEVKTRAHVTELDLDNWRKERPRHIRQPKYLHSR